MDYTRVPNFFFDYMSVMDMCEQSVVLLIARKTLGYQKEWDEISLSQFVEATGMNKPSAHKGIQKALNRGIIERRQVKNSFEYRITEPKNGSENEPTGNGMVQIMNQNSSENEPKTPDNGSKSEPIFGSKSEPKNTNGSENEPKSVQKMNTQKKKEIKTPSNEGSARHSTPVFEFVVDEPKPPDDEEIATKERRAALKTAYVEAIGHKNINHAQVGQGIKQLEKAGCTPEQLKGCHAWLKLDPFWQFKPVSPQTIFKNLSEYLRFEQVATHTNGHSVPKTSVSGQVNINFAEV